MQLEIWEQKQRLFEDGGKPRKSVLMAGRMTLR